MKGWRDLMPRPYRAWIRANGLAVLSYVVFFGSIAWFVFQRERYRDVEHWPSVEAAEVHYRSFNMPMRYEGLTGSGGGGAMLLESVSFSYQVDGRNYEGSEASPEGGRIPSPSVDRDGARHWTASYHPGHPSWAVLEGSAYRWTPGLILMICLSGFFVAGHVFFSLLLKNRP